MILLSYFEWLIRVLTDSNNAYRCCLAFPYFSERWKKLCKYGNLCDSVLLQNVKIYFSFIKNAFRKLRSWMCCIENCLSVVCFMYNMINLKLLLFWRYIICVCMCHYTVCFPKLSLVGFIAQFHFNFLGSSVRQ